MKKKIYFVLLWNWITHWIVDAVGNEKKDDDDDDAKPFSFTDNLYYIGSASVVFFCVFVFAVIIIV